MSVHSQHEEEHSHLPAQDELLHRLDQINGSLQDRIDQDHRFQSGVPEGHRASDLDFILMSGLTRPQPENLLTPADFSRPISFFEEGVADVDDAMAPATIDSEPIADEVLGDAPAATPDALQVNIIEMPGLAPPPEAADPDESLANAETLEASAPAEPAADTHEVQPEAEPEAADLASAPVEDTALLPEPAAEAEPAAEWSFADEVAAPEPEVSLLIEQYLKSVEKPAAAPAEPEPQAQELAEPPAPEPAPQPEPATAETAEVASDYVEPAPEPAAADTGMPPADLPTGPPDLAEAELFLRALENQPRDLPPEPEPAEPVAAEPPVESPLPVDVELPVREPTMRHGARRSRRSRGRARRRRIKLALAAVALVAAVFSLTGIYVWLRPVFSTPETLFADADRLAATGDYAAASAAFESFGSRYPQHASRASAQFMAAHFAAMQPTGDFDEEQAAAKRALGLFETFLRDNPTHAKAPRAWTMVAQLHYKLGQYQEAINILRDPVLRLRDPESALPGLRTLAKSYVRLGEHDSAVSAYQQAAALAGNYTPDADYEALGDLFKLRADGADDPVEVQRLRQAAIENWRFAARVPGIDDAGKAKVEDKIKWLESQTPPQPSAAPAASNAVAEQPALTPPAVAPQEQPASAASAVDPAAEAKFLGSSLGTGAAP